MMKCMSIAAAFLFCALLCASPYGRALKQARKVSDQRNRYNEPQRRRPPAPPRDEFKEIWVQMGNVIKRNKGYLPGPAGAAGLRKLCGPGGVSPALFKFNDYRKLTERNCSWAYVGGTLGVLRSLRQPGEFPILFSKPRRGVHQIKVLMADGRVKILDSRRIVNCQGVINALRRSSRSAKHPVWNKLSTAAGQIDRASK